MSLTGKIKKINETQTFGASGFRKRELILTTDDQYPQMISIEFVQDKTDLLDKYKEGQNVTISINIRGREWINPEGKAVYFNTIQGWRIEAAANGGAETANVAHPGNETAAEYNDSEPDDLPF